MNFITNLRIYLKFLSRNKLYTFVSVFGFSLSLMFVILLGLYVKQELSVDSFHEKKDRIFLISGGEDTPNSANPVGEYVSSRCPEVESFTRLVSRRSLFEKQANEKYYADILLADSTFFNIFSYKLLEGDASRVLADEFGVVLSAPFAKKYFGDVEPVGKTITIDGKQHIVSGIAQPFPSNTWLDPHDIIMNYRRVSSYWNVMNGKSILESWGNASFATIFLAKEGADIHSKSELLLNDFKKDYWIYKEGYADQVDFMPIEDVHFEHPRAGMLKTHGNNRTRIYVFLTIAIIVLVVSIINYVNMTIAQASYRGKESAIKRLLGSSRSNIVWQLLGESLLLMIVTFVLGLLLAFWIEPFFNEMLSTQLMLAQQFTLWVALGCVAFVLLMAFVTGIIPAVIISQFRPIEVVKGSFKRKLKSSYSVILIVLQYTISTALLISTTIVLKQTDYLINYNLGFEYSYLYNVNNGMDAKKAHTFAEKLRELPGVELVSQSRGTPIDGGNNYSFTYNGQNCSFQELVVDTTFFQIYNLSIMPTGVLATDDTYWLTQNAYDILRPDNVTQKVVFEDNSSKIIAGIIPDFHVRELHQVASPVQIRLLKEDEAPWGYSVKINGNAQPFEVARQIDKLYSEFTGGEPINASFADGKIQEWYRDEANTSSILAAFTLLTLIITIMGVFAMSLYLIQQKEKEIGIRKVNGATVGEILLMLNIDSLKRVFLAFVIACPIAYFAMSQWLESYPYKIALSPSIFILAGLFIVLLTLVSVSVMTWRAARTNPIDTLKGE